MINTHSATIILCCRKIIKLVYKKHARENIFVIYDRDSPIIHEDFLFYRKKVIFCHVCCWSWRGTNVESSQIQQDPFDEFDPIRRIVLLDSINWHKTVLIVKWRRLLKIVVKDVWSGWDNFEKALNGVTLSGNTIFAIK